MRLGGAPDAIAAFNRTHGHFFVFSRGPIVCSGFSFGVILRVEKDAIANIHVVERILVPATFRDWHILFDLHYILLVLGELKCIETRHLSNRKMRSERADLIVKTALAQRAWIVHKVWAATKDEFAPPSKVCSAPIGRLAG